MGESDESDNYYGFAGGVIIDRIEMSGGLYFWTDIIF